MGRVEEIAGAMIIVLILTGMSLFSGYSSGTADDEGYGPITAHGPVTVDGDDELDDLASTEGWDGDGSANDPYLMDDYQINFNGGSTGISIQNTDSHIIFSNLSFSGWGTPAWFLFTFQYVENVTIKDCNFSDSPSPISIDWSKNILVTNCSFRNHSYGIRGLLPNENFTVTNCHFHNCGYGVIGQFTSVTYCNFTSCSDGASIRGDEWILRNCYFDDNYQSLTVVGKDMTVSDSDFSSQSAGIYLNRAEGAMIRDNTVSSLRWSAISLWDTKDCVFYDNTIEKGYFDFMGIDRSTFTTNEIHENNTVSGKPVYQYLNGDQGNISARSGFGQLIAFNVSWLSIDNTTNIGSGNPIFIAYSSNLSIADNHIESSIYGLKVTQSNDISILRNNFSKSSSSGLLVSNSNRVEVFGNHFYMNDYSALSLQWGNDLEVHGNHFNKNNWTSISIGTHGALVHDNIIERTSSYGISMFGSVSGNRIYRNQIMRNEINGILMRQDPSNNIIYQNNISLSGRTGIELYRSEDNWIFENDFYANGDFGIKINDTINANVYSNKMVGDGITFDYSGGFSFPSSRMVNNNTLNGKPIRIYYGGSYSGYVMPKNTGQAILLGVSNMRISEIEISGAYAAIVLKTSTTITIEDCYIHDNSLCGIMLTSSPYIQIDRCNLSFNRFGVFMNGGSGSEHGSCNFDEDEFYKNLKHGLYLLSNNNYIMDCVFRENGHSGIYCNYGLDNMIRGNTLISNRFGIYLGWGNARASIDRNLLFRNEEYGIYINNSETGDPNDIILNVFIDNNRASSDYDPQHPQAFDVHGNNNWYTEADKGNYWSDWLTPDEDFDKIVDIPYSIGGGMVSDNKPHTRHPFTILSHPRNMEATGGNGFINLSWTEPAIDRGQGVDGYQIFRWEESGEESLIQEIESGLFFNDTTVENDNHYFYYVRAVNIFGIGNPGLEVDSWTDGTPPAIVVLNPKNDQYIDENQTRVSWDCDDDIAGVSHYVLYLDGEVEKERYSLREYDLNDLQNGPHSFKIEAHDNYGNMDDVSVNFTVDMEIPQLVINTPVDGGLYNDSWMEFNWTGTDEVSGIIKYLYRIDESGWEDIGTRTSVEFEVPGDGTHHFVLKIIDRANNTNTATVIFDIDKELPALSITYPVNDEYVTYTDLTVEWSASDALSGMDSFMISLNGGDFIETDELTNHYLTDLPQGTNTVIIRGYDLAGNFIDESVEFIIDSEKPRVISHSPTGEGVGKADEIVVEFSESVIPETVELDVGGIVGQIVWDGLIMTFKPVSPWSGGATIIVTITAMDPAGNEMIPFDWSFKIDDTGMIKGILVDTIGNPVSSATILVDGIESGTTGDYGDFELGVAPGYHEIVFTKDGFNDLHWMVNIPEGGSVELSGMYLQRSQVAPHGSDGDGDDGSILPFVIIGIVVVVLLIGLIIFLLMRSKKKSEDVKEEPVEEDPFEKAEELRKTMMENNVYIMHLQDDYLEALKLRDDGDVEGGKVKIEEYNSNLKTLVPQEPASIDEQVEDPMYGDGSVELPLAETPADEIPFQSEDSGPEEII